MNGFKVKNLIDVFKKPDEYNSNLASKEKLQRLEERVTTLEKEVKKIKYDFLKKYKVNLITISTLNKKSISKVKSKIMKYVS